ncbi:uncharacterized protein LOC143177297 [Calliopsis andreniformis]|uniref:uncharacterized protein LOC143177297 n=1 Tax=Calliopsis andreniformis TaxID=337506 RepID=UPI003FCCB3F7
METTNESEKVPEDQSEELYTWISSIPFSKPKKNLTRDFSDAVLMAEVLKVYYPRYVDLHNYAPASSLTTKKENWNTLNRKVLTKLDMKLSKDTINQLASSQPGAAEHLLLDVKNKILKSFEHQNPQNPLCDKNKDSVEEGKINESTKTVEENVASVESTSTTLTYDKSIFLRVKEKLFFVVWWIIAYLCIWNYFPSPKSLLLKNKLKDADTSDTQSTLENINEEDAVPRHVCTQLRQELREKDDIICTLNHKLAYLESAMKLKDLRISNLTSQILQNAVESEQFLKSQANNDAQIKFRARPQNIREKVKVEE